MKITKQDTILIVIAIISLALIIHGMMNVGSKDKKMAQAAQGEVATGIVGLGGFIIKKTFVLTGAWVALILGGALLSPKVFSSWWNTFMNIFRPTPAIPIWVYIIGFMLFFFVVIKK